MDLFPLKFRCSSLYLIIKWNFIILILSNTTVFSMIFLSNSTLILIMIIFIMFVCFAKIHLNNYYIFIHISYNFSSVFCFALNYSHAHQLNCQLLKVSRQKGIYKLIFRKAVFNQFKDLIMFIYVMLYTYFQKFLSRKFRCHRSVILDFFPRLIQY